MKKIIVQALTLFVAVAQFNLAESNTQREASSDESIGDVISGLASKTVEGIISWMLPKDFGDWSSLFNENESEKRKAGYYWGADSDQKEPESVARMMRIDSNKPRATPQGGQQKPNYQPQTPPQGGQQTPYYPPQAPPQGGQQRPYYPPQVPPQGGQQRPYYQPQAPLQGGQQTPYYPPQAPLQGSQQRPYYQPQVPYQGGQQGYGGQIFPPQSNNQQQPYVQCERTSMVTVGSGQILGMPGQPQQTLTRCVVTPVMPGQMPGMQGPIQLMRRQMPAKQEQMPAMQERSLEMGVGNFSKQRPPQQYPPSQEPQNYIPVEQPLRVFVHIKPSGEVPVPVPVPTPEAVSAPVPASTPVEASVPVPVAIRKISLPAGTKYGHIVMQPIE